MFSRGSVIIIVSEVDETKKNLQRNLLGLGFQKAVEAAGPAEAMAKLKSNALSGVPFTLLFFDWNPFFKGNLESLRRICACTTSRKIPIIVLIPRQELDCALLKAGGFMQGYVVMPITEDGLKTSLSAVWAAHKLSLVGENISLS